MTIITGDCIEAMAAMEAESIDSICTDPPYGLEFMGKAWDAPWKKGAGTGEHNAGFAPMDGAADARLGHEGRTWFGSRDAKAPNYLGGTNPTCRNCGGTQNGNDRKSRRRCRCDSPSFPNTQLPRQLAFGQWSQAWAEAAYRIAKPSAYLLAFGGTRTVHRLTTAIEDAGWIIRDMLVWAYASGFPKSKASLKPAWEPIVMARKPGPLRDLAIDACRIGVDGGHAGAGAGAGARVYGDGLNGPRAEPIDAGRWPANVILTDPIFDGGWDGVVGGGEAAGSTPFDWTAASERASFPVGREASVFYDDSGTYSRFFLVPKADRADREPVLGGLPTGFAPTMGNGIGGREHDPANVRAYRRNIHPTVKPVDLMRHLVRLVTPTGGIVLDPFLGSGTTAIAAEMEGFDWIGIEKEADYVAISEARLNGTQRGLGLPA